jgi:hypothetical protein
VPHPQSVLVQADLPHAGHRTEGFLESAAGCVSAQRRTIFANIKTRLDAIERKSDPETPPSDDDLPF